jgi:hypothetical protein
MRRVYRWREAEGGGLQHVLLIRETGVIAAEGMILAGGDEPYAARYRIVMDGRWRVRRASVALIGRADPLVLVADGQGGWTGTDGAEIPDLQGVADVDFSATPFTNTLPIRRLRVGVGKSADVDTAYVDFPTLAVRRDAQRYTRVEERLWRYEARDGSFEREITVDEDGVVVEYPGLFSRVG